MLETTFSPLGPIKPAIISPFPVAPFHNPPIIWGERGELTLAMEDMADQLFAGILDDLFEDNLPGK